MTSPTSPTLIKRKYAANEQDLTQQSEPDQKIPKFSEPLIIETHEHEANNNTENTENNNNENTNDTDDFELYNDDDFEEQNPNSPQQSQSQQSQQSQSHAAPQRKKPGRKPNPASPALRKAQNRAAQRAFRERKERHLRDLENTIKLLRDDQYQENIKFQYECQRLNNLIDHLQRENSYFKKLSLMFECALNNIHGDCIATDEIKKAITTNTDYPVDKTTTTTTTPDESLSSSTLSSSDINNGQQQHISLSSSLDTSQRPLPSLNINNNHNNKNNLINKLIKPKSTNLANNKKNGNGEMIPRHDRIVESNDDDIPSGTNTSINLSPDPFGNLCSINPTTTTTNSCLFPQDYSTTTTTNDHVVIPDYSKSFINIPSQINNNDNNGAFLNFNDNSTIVSNDNNNGSISSILDFLENKFVDDFICSDNDNNNVGPNLFNIELSLNDFNEDSFIQAFINDNSAKDLVDSSNNTSSSSSSSPSSSSSSSSCFPYNKNDHNNQSISSDNIIADTNQSSPLSLPQSSSSSSEFLFPPLTRDKRQLLRLAEKVGAKGLTPITPKLKHPLSDQQIQYLNMEHDSRIDMIPCLHLRSRMIQHSGRYDLYELCEILIEKAKCHGDPLDTDSWELPDEIFQNYSYLTFRKCHIKSLLYKRDGAIPKDFTALFENGDYCMSIS